MSWGKRGSPGRVTWWAWPSYGVIVAEVLTGAALWFGDGWTFADGAQNFLVTDSLLAMTFALCGVLVAWRRSRNPIGWLLLCGGAAHGTTVLMVGLLSFGLVHGWSEPTLGVIVTAATASRPLGLRLFIPFALLLFPTGTLSRRFRPVAGLTVVIAVLFEWWSLITSSPYSVGGPPPYTGTFAIQALEPIRLQLDLAAIVVPMLIGVAVLAVRYRHGDERQRRQMLWLPYAAFRLDGRETATSGQPDGRVEMLPLLTSDTGGVELVAGVRQGQSRLDPEDLRVLGVLVAPLAVAYRIVVEALTNVAKHSAADRARVEISVSDELCAEVIGNGGSSSTAWHRGVGRVSAALLLDTGGGRRVGLTRSSPASPD
ncbi:hypothetical protein [Kutzneria kofuensis]|uniref:Histidine kinase n=1 Tax=Kutzneria kofuensis TaxID=103725 RepID=A0A7W9KDR7_9PSEU|nr:hypothetical protein [Kutzneria kofuensis]MBB5890328.1 hypothetical protein [Kutzneria kofuensis]